MPTSDRLFYPVEDDSFSFRERGHIEREKEKNGGTQ